MIRAMVFDLDGTLVQTEKLKAQSYARAAVTLKPDLEESAVVAEFKEVVGRSRQEVAQHLLDRFDLAPAAAEHMPRFAVDTPWQAYVQMRLQIYQEMLADERTILDHQWPHTMKLLHRARESCGKVGLATMSYCNQVRRVLQVLGLGNTFDFVASRDDVEHGKPDPEIYLLVADELAVRPDECLVIEDSPSGVQAAINAGMRYVAVSTPFTRSNLHSSGFIDSRWIVDEPDQLFGLVDQVIHEEHEEAS